ncbi:MAG: hypothetical protein J2P46_06030 [Zavarzinella sp.]|nr:hypothetical protein [Zavarzinella sp.]
MNRIAFDLRLVKASDEPFVQDYFALDIRVDDRDLLEFVRETERPFASAEGHPDLAGKYEALPAFMALEDFAGKGAEKVSVYDCECGCFGCWPLRVRISASDKTVTWSEFEQPHRGRKSRASWWRYDKLGPFVFERGQYDSALTKAASELRDRQRTNG